MKSIAVAATMQAATQVTKTPTHDIWPSEHVFGIGCPEPLRHILS